MASKRKKRKHCTGWCSAPNCRNSRLKCPDRSFFRFPKNEARAKEWVIACKRYDLLNKSADHLYSSVKLCSDHFDDEAFSNASKYRLRKTAVPTKFGSDARPPCGVRNISTSTVQEANVFPVVSESIQSSKGLYRLPIDTSLEELGWVEGPEGSEILSRVGASQVDDEYLGCPTHLNTEPDLIKVEPPSPLQDSSNCEELIMVEPIIVVHGGAGNYTYANVELCLKGVRAAAVTGYQVLQRGGSILEASVAAVEVMEDAPEFNAVHGGAGYVSDERAAGKLVSIRKAAIRGYETLRDSGCVMKATIAAVEFMEDDPLYNAGRGSVLNLNGKVEMEALVMEGKYMQVGSVTGLTNVAHPISVAKLVMDLPHSILGFESATAFAHQNGFPFVADSELITPAALQALENFKKGGKSPAETEIPGTVGAVGIDSSGHMVSCTSTGGMNGKMAGRVGDTPIPGSGGYCDDNIGTVSATGNGESILRYNVSQRILAYLEAGKTAQEATRLSVEGMTKRVGGDAGAITIAKNGDVGIAFTSKRMAWAYVRGPKLYYGIDPNEILEEEL